MHKQTKINSIKLLQKGISSKESLNAFRSLIFLWKDYDQNFLNISDISLEDIRKLPLAVVIARGTDVKVYKIESKDVHEYFHLLKYDGPSYPFKDVLKATEKFGRPMSKEDLLKIPGFLPEGPNFFPQGSYAIYKIKPDETKK